MQLAEPPSVTMITPAQRQFLAITPQLLMTDLVGLTGAQMDRHIKEELEGKWMTIAAPVADVVKTGQNLFVMTLHFASQQPRGTLDAYLEFASDYAPRIMLIKGGEHMEARGRIARIRRMGGLTYHQLYLSDCELVKP